MTDRFIFPPRTLGPHEKVVKRLYSKNIFAVGWVFLLQRGLLDEIQYEATGLQSGGLTPRDEQDKDDFAAEAVISSMEPRSFDLERHVENLKRLHFQAARRLDGTDRTAENERFDAQPRWLGEVPKI